MKNKILNLIKKKNCVVGVVGLGYVGLDLLITLSKNKIKNSWI